MAVVDRTPTASAAAASLTDAQLVLQAVLRAADELALSRTALARVLGKDRSTLSRATGIDPANKTGELALLLIRLYRSLSVLVGNDAIQLRHWFHTPNRHTGGVPAEQVLRAEGLIEVVHYLDAMRAPI
ncbi:MAG: antitoxin Xre/MbcA/ParS toxin-binding domain-containing protein [Prochlorococcus sp.]|nr:MbcA/ParS/Xre antitoxin family protein [Prochlorococcaceae cyanobacterium Fu_MAG_50]